MANKVNLIGGNAYLRIGGTQYMSRGDWTYTVGTPTREAVFDGANVVGYTEKPNEPMVEGEITIPAGLNVTDITEIDDTTITLELDNGDVVTLRNAWYSGDGKVAIRDGKITAKFTGKSLEIA